MIIKICGIREVKTLKFLTKKQINYFGLIFYEKSPRYIDINNAKKLMDICHDSPINGVGVFVDYPLNKIQKLGFSSTENFLSKVTSLGRAALQHAEHLKKLKSLSSCL